MAMDEGSEVCVERAFRKVVENPLALHSLMACGCDDVEEEKERAEKDDGKAEKRRSRGTSVFESLCSLSALQDNERTLFFNASLGEAWATKDMEVLFRTDSSYTKLWRAHLHSHGLLRGVLSSFIDFCASDWHSHFDTKVSLKETKSEHARVQRLPRNLTIERRSSLIMAEKTPPSKRRRSQKSIIVKEKMDDMIEIERLAEKERREERERKEVEVVGKHLDLLMEYLLCFVDRFPRSLFEHSTDLSHVLLFKFGDSCERRFFHAIFFLRYVCPALSLPGAFASAPLSDEVTSHFRVISRVLQNLVSNSFFKNDQMKQYNPYLESRHDAMEFLMHTLCCRPESPSALQESIHCLRSILSLPLSCFPSSFSSPLSGLPLSPLASPLCPLSPFAFPQPSVFSNPQHTRSPLGSRSQSTSSLLCTSLSNSSSSQSSPRADVRTTSYSPLVDLASLPCASKSEAFQEIAKGEENSENVPLVQIENGVASSLSPKSLQRLEVGEQEREKERERTGGMEGTNELKEGGRGEVFGVNLSFAKVSSRNARADKKEGECILLSEPTDYSMESRWSRFDVVTSPVWPIPMDACSPLVPFSRKQNLISSPSLFSFPPPVPSHRMWKVLFDFLQGKESKLRSKVHEAIGLNDFLVQYHAFSTALSSSPPSSLPPSLPPLSSSKAIFEAMICLKNLSRALFFYFSKDPARYEGEDDVTPAPTQSTVAIPPATFSKILPTEQRGRLASILYNEEYRDAFYEFLQRNFMAEPFEMWQAIEHISVSANKRRDFIALCEEYVLPNSPSPAPLSYTTIEILRQRYLALSYPSYLSSPLPTSSAPLTYQVEADYSFLLGVSMELWAVMASSCLLPFIQSDVWRAISSGVYAEAVERSREKAEWFFGSKIEGDLCRTEIVTVVRKDYFQRNTQLNGKSSRKRSQSLLFRRNPKSPALKERRSTQKHVASSSSPREKSKSKKRQPSSTPTLSVEINSLVPSSSTNTSGFSSSFSTTPTSRPPSLIATSSPMTLTVGRSSSQAISQSKVQLEVHRQMTSASSSFTISKDMMPNVTVVIKAPSFQSETDHSDERESTIVETEPFRFNSGNVGGQAMGFMCFVEG